MDTPQIKTIVHGLRLEVEETLYMGAYTVQVVTTILLAPFQQSLRPPWALEQYTYLNHLCTPWPTVGDTYPVVEVPVDVKEVDQACDHIYP